MPFEDAHGNGGLLTTVGDLLRWSGHYDSPSRDDADTVRQQQEPARLSSGEVLDYALGLFVQRYGGLLEVAHGGSTAGYRAYLARFPERRVAVAVLCNAATATADVYAHAVADIYLGARTPGEVRAASGSGQEAQRQATALADGAGGRAGMFREVVTGRVLVLQEEKGALRLEGGGALVASGSRFRLPDGSGEIEFDGSDRLVVRLPNGLAKRYERVAPARPTLDELRAFEGIYASDEVEAEYAVLIKDGLWLLRRPATRIALKPLYADAFIAPGLATILFRRQAGRVVEMSVMSDRVWDLRFKRISAPPAAR
jgi:hypothetical protein